MTYLDLHHDRVAGGVSRGRLAGAALALACAVLGGCGHPRAEARRVPAWVFESSREERPFPTARQHVPRGGIRGRSGAADLVVAALQEQGLRFGTDGSVASLWGYLRTSNTPVGASESRVGDVVFFYTRSPSPEGCDGPDHLPDHVGIVTAVDPDGRITFAEARGARVRRSYVAPDRPRVRRDAAGRVLNTFIRTPRMGDGPNTPAYAGEMFCAVLRPKS